MFYITVSFLALIFLRCRDYFQWNISKVNTIFAFLSVKQNGTKINSLKRRKDGSEVWCAVLVFPAFDFFWRQLIKTHLCQEIRPVRVWISIFTKMHPHIHAIWENCVLNYSAWFIFPRNYCRWNCLPETLVTASILDSFKLILSTRAFFKLFFKILLEF